MIEQFNPFTDIDYLAPTPANNVSMYASQISGNFQQIQIGSGDVSFKSDSSGIWLGSLKFADAPFSVDMYGNVWANSITIAGLAGSVIASSIDADGNFVKQLLSSNFNTQTKLILGEFSFSGSGAIAIKSDASNGIWLSPSGILAKKAGSTTFAIDTSGNATFSGTITASTIYGGYISGGTIVGAIFTTSDGSAGTGYRVYIGGGSNVGVQFYYENTWKGTIRGDSGNSMVYDSADKHWFAYQGSNLIHFSPSDQRVYLDLCTNIQNGTGRRLKFDDSEIRAYADWCPGADKSQTLGYSNLRWDTLWSKYLNTGDIIFSDRYCPVCEQEFQEGDMLVNFAYKKDSTIPDLPRTYTVPAHFPCVSDYKKSKHKSIQDFIKAKDDEHEQYRTDNMHLLEKDHKDKVKVDDKRTFED